ncbi:hypothetical protein SDC9_13766 [bioreactor metagenome]|uniref:Uncharacterized protein n=1 Tax=bioreactor metagenome TaxID=1076179 RepID=A0A644TM92_9ZZZZ|nr:hypothetical protein [Negativicutes bacterium]
MVRFTKVKKVVNDEKFFTKALIEGSSIELARVKLDLRREKAGVLLLGTVNWRATFPSTAFDTGGWAEVTFELLRDGAVIYRIHQSAVQGENIGNLSSPPIQTVFRITTLRHFDTASVFGKPEKVRYALRATNIIMIDPIGDTPVVVTAHIGAVTFTAQEIEASIPE